MENKTPLVSIITVSYNSEKTIEQTIFSVNNQTYSNIEHIFIDGHSSDNTVEIIRKKSKRDNLIISEKDKGIYDGMNKGLKYSNGDLIFILNSDDVFFSLNTVSKVVKEFETDKKLMILYGHIVFSKNNDLGKIIRKWKSSEYFNGSFKRGWHPPHPGFVVKKTVYEKHGNFDLNFKIAADYELMFRFIEEHRVKSKFYDDYIAILRYGGESTKVKGIYQTMKDLLGIYRKHNFKNPLFLITKRYLNKALQLIK